MTNPTDFLLGGGTKSAKFDRIGDEVSGTIASPPEVRQQTDMTTGKPKVWDNGDPVMQLVVRLQTDQRDPADPDDDGVRAVYVKGSKKPESKSLHAAVAGAVRASGAKSLEVGGRLTVRFVGEGVAERRGFNPPKHYEATYVPPAAGFLGADQPVAQQQPAQQAAPAAAAPAAPQQAEVDVTTTVKNLIAAGLDDGLIAQSTGLTPEAVAALRNVA